MQRSTWSYRVRREPSTPRKQVITCSVCGFPGVPAGMTPGARIGLKPVEITGTVYVGPDADSPVTSFDKQVMTIRQAGECPCCGAERYMDGRRGSGNRVP
jgi:hypothetical protein